MTRYAKSPNGVLRAVFQLWLKHRGRGQALLVLCIYLFIYLQQYHLNFRSPCMANESDILLLGCWCISPTRRQRRTRKQVNRAVARSMQRHQLGLQFTEYLSEITGGTQKRSGDSGEGALELRVGLRTDWRQSDKCLTVEPEEQSMCGLVKFELRPLEHEES